MLDWKQCPVVERFAGKVGGTWLFKGTRVPVQALFENLKDGAATEEFLAWFPGVTREQVRAVLEFVEQSLAADSMSIGNVRQAGRTPARG